jgi:predicted short-subunit dehydrogenase-like oxidoreductase (DUF2520 family)
MTEHLCEKKNTYKTNKIKKLKSIGKEIDFKILLPLIKQTVRKIESSKPSEVQTGPAIREDYGSIEKHLVTLKNEAPEFLDLYQLMTNMIIQSKNK